MNPYLLGGIAGAVGSGLEEANKTKLQMAMTSARLEKEAELQKQREQYQQQLAGISPEAFSTIAGLSGQKLQPEQLASLGSPELSGKIPGHTANAAFGMLGKLGAANQRTQNRPPKMSMENVGNEVHFVMRDPMTGEIIKQENRGINPSFQKEAAKVQSDFSSVQPIFDKLHNAVDKFLSPEYLSRLPQGASTRLSTLIQSGDPEAMNLIQARKAYAIWLTASISGKQMTEAEQKAFLDLLPTPEDTVEYAKNKLNILESMTQGKVQGAFKAFTGNSQPGQEAPKPQDPFEAAITRRNQREAAFAQQQSAIKGSNKGTK